MASNDNHSSSQACGPSAFIWPPSNQIMQDLIMSRRSLMEPGGAILHHARIKSRDTTTDPVTNHRPLEAKQEHQALTAALALQLQQRHRPSGLFGGGATKTQLAAAAAQQGQALLTSVVLRQLRSKNTNGVAASAAAAAALSAETAKQQHLLRVAAGIELVGAKLRIEKQRQHQHEHHQHLASASSLQHLLCAPLSRDAAAITAVTSTSSPTAAAATTKTTPAPQQKLLGSSDDSSRANILATVAAARQQLLLRERATKAQDVSIISSSVEDHRLKEESESAPASAVGAAAKAKATNATQAARISKGQPQESAAAAAAAEVFSSSAANVADEGGDKDDGGNSGSNSETMTFPFKLYDMLMDAERDGNDDIVSFLIPQTEEGQQGQGNDRSTSSNNNGFRLHKPKKFVNHIMPKYFTTKRLASFQRQLNLYGFRRATRGPNKGAYFHEYLVKGQRHECKNIKRRKSNNIITNSNHHMMPASSYNFLAARQNNNNNNHAAAQWYLYHVRAGQTPSAPINVAAAATHHHHLPSLVAVQRKLLAQQKSIFPSSP